MSTVICARCVSDRILDHAYWCDMHPTNRIEPHESLWERAQRPWSEEADSEAIGRLWRAVQGDS